MHNFLSIALFTYVLAAIIMFLVPESWMPKKGHQEEMGIEEDAVTNEGTGKGYYRKVFLLFGLGVLVILFLASYIIG